MNGPLISRRRRLLVLLLDVVLFAIAYAGAYAVRMDVMPYPTAWHAFERTVLTLLLLKAAVFVLAGSYRGLVMYATIPDLRRDRPHQHHRERRASCSPSPCCRRTSRSRAACSRSTGC